MILINSGAYVIQELQAEYGKLPPCMLPLANRRLIEHQVLAIRKNFSDEKIVLSLPESYALGINDEVFLHSLSVDIVFVPDGYTLAESILFVLNTRTLDVESSVRLMHGDTLIYEMPKNSDVIGISSTSDDYPWELESENCFEEVIWCGYFSFSSPQMLIQALAWARGDFIDAIHRYSGERKLERELVSRWHDFGHVNTYFKSRSLITTQRSFNTLAISNGVVRKSGIPNRKIEAEAKWFKNVPDRIKIYIPQLIEYSVVDKSASYSIEFLPLSALNEIFVHGRNPPFFWRKIFGLFRNLFADLHAVVEFSDTQCEVIRQDVFSLYKEKTFRRLQEFSTITGFNTSRPLMYNGVVTPSLIEIANICVEQVLSLDVIPSVMHGDLCFSNTLYDPRSELLKVIDPRGMLESGEFSIYGDQKYDLAKLAHSVIGLYDYIISGNFHLEISEDVGMHIDFYMDERTKSIQKMFLDFSFIPEFSTTQIIPAVILLFLSMLPLHADRPDRQNAMVANALRLYSNYCTSESIL